MGCRLEVRVAPKSGRDAVVVEESGRVKVWVTAAPERGKANEAVVALLAKVLGVPKGSVSVVRGLSSRNKVLVVKGLSEPEARERLAGKN